MLPFLKWFPLLLLLASMAMPACSNSDEATVEEAKYALDSEDWDESISLAMSVLNSDPSNVRAALVASSAYAGRGGFRILDLLIPISQDIKSRDLFGAIYDVLIERGSVNVNDIRQAIRVILENVSPEPEVDNKNFVDYHFQYGILMVLEHYALPSFTARPVKDGPIDVNAITAEIKDIVQNDMILFDEALVDAGLAEDDEIIENNRQTYCVLQRASTTSDGFDLEVLRDLVLCQLSPEDGAELTAADFQSSITSCDDFAYDACTDQPDTTL